MSKMKIYIDEWYPVYGISKMDDYGDIVTIPNELIERFKANEKEFYEIQKELRKLHEEAGYAD